MQAFKKPISISPYTFLSRKTTKQQQQQQKHLVFITPDCDSHECFSGCLFLPPEVGQDTQSGLSHARPFSQVT